MKAHAESYRTLGSSRVRREFIDAHVARLHRWFTGTGRFIGPGWPLASRERLWNAMSLLQHGGRRELRLADAIIRGTPINNDGFLPIAAADMLLTYPRKLSPQADRYLRRTLRDTIVLSLDVRFSSEGLHNFTAMTTFALLAAARLLEGYRFPHPLAYSDIIYTADRLKMIGRNALLALWAADVRAGGLSHEFNSPTYTPITLLALAKTAEHAEDDHDRELALRLELRLWRELLAMWHPRLNVPCGPFSRAYRVDMLGQTSLQRALMCHVGLSADDSIPAMLDGRRADLHVHHAGDLPFNWANIAWLVAGDYHVPGDAIAGLRRGYPHRVQGACHWPPFGHFDLKSKKYVPVQGRAFPGGSCRVFQEQHRDWAIGWRTDNHHFHSFPIHLHYALVRGVCGMDQARHVTAAVVLHGKPQEHTTDPTGKTVDGDGLNNAGPVQVWRRGQALRFIARPFAEFCRIPAAEVSLNSLIPTHFKAIDCVELNAQVFDDEPIELVARRAICRVRDHGFVYQIGYEFERPIRMRLFRWARFIRFAAFWYEGDEKLHSAARLQGMTGKGWLRVETAPGK